ncbi:MAG: hypothetical protein QI199_08220 [Candidatus Korarchaeota archaeon]|nr:hypothetical protein [Candidatus Korarchaeota archaeon]
MAEVHPYHLSAPPSKELDRSLDDPDVVWNAGMVTVALDKERGDLLRGLSRPN